MGVMHEIKISILKSGMAKHWLAKESNDEVP